MTTAPEMYAAAFTRFLLAWVWRVAHSRMRPGRGAGSAGPAAVTESATLGVQFRAAPTREIAPRA
jgi:hypothetical protein